jgi:RP/EB family microtubule-associated protein|mmetsp:Transcript_34914/g.58430  ORF Transcript_34914/g.58430 Transcript_34914/m.58430 type:complete len:264 (-) Transcript_34914:1328-2119(-)
MSKTQILSWINEFLGLSYTKIEQTCSGVVALQVMDALHSGAVPMNKVNFNAKNEYEFGKNLKLLQIVFVNVGIEKVIDIDKLAKGKYQDNFEFMQWLKVYFDHNNKDEPYDAVARRQQFATARKAMSDRKACDVKEPSCTPLGERTNIAPSNVAAKAKPNPNQLLRSQSVAQPTNTVRMMQTKIDGLEQQAEEMREVQCALEKQRDFYYGKLRNVEILLDDDGVLDVDMKVLRSTIQSILFNPAGDFICMEEPSNVDDMDVGL